MQLKTDPRYQEFIGRAEERDVLGHRMKVAAIRDVLQGKVWACSDSTRRASKRQKDLADIMRLVEVRPELASDLPDAIRRKLEQARGAVSAMQIGTPFGCRAIVGTRPGTYGSGRELKMNTDERR